MQMVTDHLVTIEETLEEGIKNENLLTLLNPLVVQENPLETFSGRIRVKQNLFQVK